MPQGTFTVPTRVYLTAEQRAQLLALLQEHELDLAELLTDVLTSFLNHMPPADEANTRAVGDSLPPWVAAVRDTLHNNPPGNAEGS